MFRVKEKHKSLILYDFSENVQYEKFLMESF